MNGSMIGEVGEGTVGLASRSSLASGGGLGRTTLGRSSAASSMADLAV